ncbi:gamma-glutamyl-phosphate reductase [Bhargavaea cecembensis]|uniref:Gamma-glutamyl phosphate reductase n=1 Tax=Bhargavaea cecembensis TaxID=394098 RepID=A0A165HGX1_9BACL|nr:glutamate-5-semialdehyde dehydrogenase [Bhargavaea cecembensis]KZE39909.1 gamma-glutamyl-phosphate reductase [Bhargavaea cecembensis]
MTNVQITQADELQTKGEKAKHAASIMGGLTTPVKDEALKAISAGLLSNTPSIIEANHADLEAGREAGLSDSLLDRLMLDEGRIKAMADALIDLTKLTDPVGQVLEEWERPNGLKLSTVRVPLGVVGIIYEARPNVTVDAAALCLKTGNAVILRGSSSAIHSNKALVSVIREAIATAGLPEDAVQLVEDTSRETAARLFKMNDVLDVLIPRGSANLIRTVVDNATVPVIETGAGNCHVYIDETADKDMAISIAVNAKTQRPSVCNAAEKILIHQNWPHTADLVAALQWEGVVVHGDDAVVHLADGVLVATDEDWGLEYLDLEVAVKIVASTEEAIAHINTYGTRHSEAIVTSSLPDAAKFQLGVDAAAVYHNASTRFTDGFEFGFGAELGISTQKLHARGPMGLPALTSVKTLISGHGQCK